MVDRNRSGTFLRLSAAVVSRKSQPMVGRVEKPSDKDGIDRSGGSALLVSHRAQNQRDSWFEEIEEL